MSTKKCSGSLVLEGSFKIRQIKNTINVKAL